MSEILKKEVCLSSMGKGITTKLLLNNPSPYLIVFVLFMKENNGKAKISDLFERYIVNNIGDSIGNVGYLSHVIKDGVNCGLLEVKE